MSFNFEQLAERWPSPIVARSEVGRFTGGLLHPRTLANLDALGQGPKGRIYLGRRVGYSVDSLVEFLRERTRHA